MQISVSIIKTHHGWLVKVRGAVDMQGIELIMPTHKEALSEASRLVTLLGPGAVIEDVEERS